MSGVFAGALSVFAPVGIGVSVIGIAVVAVGYLGASRSAVRHG
jgi:hypothetical protein